MILCLLSSFFLFVALVWQSYDTSLATYHLVKTGPGSGAELSRMNASLGSMFILMSAQWSYLYADVLQEHPSMMAAQLVIHLSGFVLVIAIISHVLISWKLGAYKRT